MEERDIVKIWARYYLGTGLTAKIFDGTYDVEYSPCASEMVKKIEDELFEKHKKDIQDGKACVIDHYQIMSSI